jgi:hypothetical protein
MMDSFREGYDRFIKLSASWVASNQGDEYVKTVQAKIDKLQRDINSFKEFRTPDDKLKGDIAEFWHSGTHNIDAAVRGIQTITTVDRSHDFASPDISSTDGNKYGLKYYKDGHSSAKAQSTNYFQSYMEYKAKSKSDISFIDYLRERHIDENDVLAFDPIYNGQIRIIPKEQLEDATNFLKRKIAEESVKRPELVKQYQETLDMLDTKIKTSEGAESIPLTEEEARQIAGTAKQGKFSPEEHGISPEKAIKPDYILEQSLKAGLSAAVISMVLRIVPELYRLIEELIADGKIDVDELKKTGFSTLKAGTEGFVRGSISAALTVACKSGQLGNILKNVDSAVISAITIVTMNVIQNSYKLAKHQITKGEFVNSCIRDLFITTSSLLLGSVTQGVFPQIPVLGYLIGSFIGSIAAAFIYDMAYKSFLSFCCESGFTFFGLVEQNYELPIDILKEIGIKVFEYKKFIPKSLELKTFQPKQINLKTFKPKTLDITFVRRGVIGVNRIGYVT